MEFLPYTKLSLQERKLVDAAENALKTSYSPYFKKYVGAAILTSTGKIITGSNFGNASTSVNVCAERAVVLTANSLGYRDLVSLAMIDKNGADSFEPLTPCGICRQFLWEINKITGKDLVILSSNSDKTKIIKTTVSELLPYPYK